SPAALRSRAQTFSFPPAKTQGAKYLYMVAFRSVFRVGFLAHPFWSLSRTVKLEVMARIGSAGITSSFAVIRPRTLIGCRWRTLVSVSGCSATACDGHRVVVIIGRSQ